MDAGSKYIFLYNLLFFLIKHAKKPSGILIAGILIAGILIATFSCHPKMGFKGIL
jgi:hypothetical protein